MTDKGKFDFLLKYLVNKIQSFLSLQLFRSHSLQYTYSLYQFVYNFHCMSCYRISNCIHSSHSSSEDTFRIVNLLPRDLCRYPHR